MLLVKLVYVIYEVIDDFFLRKKIMLDEYLIQIFVDQFIYHVFSFVPYVRLDFQKPL